MKLFVLYAAIATLASSYPEASAQLTVSSKPTKLISADTSLASGGKSRSLRTAETYPSIDTEERAGSDVVAWREAILNEALQGKSVTAMVSAAKHLEPANLSPADYRELIETYIPRVIKVRKKELKKTFKRTKRDTIEAADLEGRIETLREQLKTIRAQAAEHNWNIDLSAL